jgi:hypothetical protein
VLALERRRDIASLGRADTQTELVVRNLSLHQPHEVALGSSTHKRHPFLVKHVVACRYIGRHVTADRVTHVLGAVRVELSSRVSDGLGVSVWEGERDQMHDCGN